MTKIERTEDMNEQTKLSLCTNLGLLRSGRAIFTVTGLWAAGELRGLKMFFCLKPSHLTGGRTPTEDRPGCCRG